MIASYKYRDVLKEKMKNPTFRKEWEKTQKEFDLACQMIELRLKSGMTQKELAQKAKTSQPAIARVESGSYRNVTMDFLRKIGDVYGLEPRIVFRKSSGWRKRTIHHKTRQIRVSKLKNTEK
jgi:DNA-binding XRE family transcriptional regulator